MITLSATRANDKYVTQLVEKSEELSNVLNDIKEQCETRSGFLYEGNLSTSTVDALKSLGYKVQGTEGGYTINWKLEDESEARYSQIMNQFSANDTIIKKEKLITILCIVIILLMFLLGSVVFVTTQTKQIGLIALLDTPNQSLDIPDWDPDAIVPPADDTVQKLNEKLDMGKMCINMLSKVVFENTYAYGTMNIYNDEANNYPQFVTITNDSNGVIIYQSGLVEVGKGIPYAALDVVVPAGEHECTAVFTQVDPATNKICGQAAAKVTIVIKE